MPRTKTGRKVLKVMKETYGKDAEDVYYASIVKAKPGTSKWEKPKKGGKLAKAKRTYKRK